MTRIQILNMPTAPAPMPPTTRSYATVVASGFESIKYLKVQNEKQNRQIRKLVGQLEHKEHKPRVECPKAYRQKITHLEKTLAAKNALIKEKNVELQKTQKLERVQKTLEEKNATIKKKNVEITELQKTLGGKNATIKEKNVEINEIRRQQKALNGKHHEQLEELREELKKEREKKMVKEVTVEPAQVEPNDQELKIAMLEELLRSATNEHKAKRDARPLNIFMSFLVSFCIFFFASLTLFGVAGSM